MRKAMLCAIIALSCGWVAQAQKSQNDTILVKSLNIKFDKETYESKTGKSKTDYLALIDGEWYYTNKTSYEKYFKIRKFGGTPNVFFVKPKESKVKSTPKVIVL